MKNLANTFLFFSALTLLVSCDFAQKLESKARSISNYEVSALNLSKENRQLQVKLGQLEAEIQALKTKNNYLSMQLEDKAKASGASTRRIASVGPKKADAVQFDIYQWTPSQLLAMASNEFGRENYDQSAQYYMAFMTNFKGHESINDDFLYQAGVAAYQSGKRPEWVEASLKKLVADYPTSKFYRGAKLWLALNNLKQGKRGEFFQTVEEFRQRYRNTPEWKILSVHYEEIVQKYKD